MLDELADLDYLLVEDSGAECVCVCVHFSST